MEAVSERLLAQSRYSDKGQAQQWAKELVQIKKKRSPPLARSPYQAQEEIALTFYRTSTFETEEEISDLFHALEDPSQSHLCSPLACDNQVGGGAGFDPEKAPFIKDFVRNVAYVIYPESTEVGPALYQVMIGRESQKVTLVTLSDIDLQTPLRPLSPRERRDAGGKALVYYALPGAGLLVLAVMRVLAFE
ncbi:hypothetical protein ACSSS7_007305 [Eimeria intestinalis]